MLPRSSIASGCTRTRTSRPAWMAKARCTPLNDVATVSSASSRLIYRSTLSRRAPGRPPEPPGDIGPDQRVRPLDFVVHRLANVVQQRRGLGDADVRAQFGGHVG